eukprot:gene6528-3170_t
MSTSRVTHAQAKQDKGIHLKRDLPVSMRPLARPLRGRASSPSKLVVYVLAALAGLLTVRGAARPSASVEEEELLIGWKGETFDTGPNGRSALATDHNDSREEVDRQPWIETISWQPRAFVHHNFLTLAECDYLVSLGQKRVDKSTVVDEQGKSVVDPIRTSYGGSFGIGEDPIIAGIEERIAEWSHVPPHHGEQIQILRYENGQKYDAHWDWFGEELTESQFGETGDRVATVLMYLSDVEEGGETNLPLATPIDEELQKHAHGSPCAVKNGISVPPRKGDALLFFDLDVGGQKGDHQALHASCPTLKGMKWTATKWIHSKPYSI